MIMNVPFQESTAMVPTASSSSSSSMVDPSGKKRNSLLNKFLSKTYHLINSCDPSIACWSNGGTAFTIKDQERFEKEVLPAYFNHSKFSSFQRQLNFYAFTKLRDQEDLQLRDTEAVRFSHPFFQQGKPELLHRIARSTAVKSASDSHRESSQVENLQRKVDMLQQQVRDLEGSMDEKIRQATEGHVVRIRALEASYERLIAALISPLTPSLAAASTATPAAAWPASSSPVLNSLDPGVISTFVRSQQQKQQQKNSKPF